MDGEGINETLKRDCERGRVGIDTASMLRDMKADHGLKQMLRFWIGQNIIAMENYPVLIGRTKKTADMVMLKIVSSS